MNKILGWLRPKGERRVVSTSASRLAKFRHDVEGVVALYHLNGLTATQAIEEVASLARAVSDEVTA